MLSQSNCIIVSGSHVEFWIVIKVTNLMNIPDNFLSFWQA